MAVIDVDELTVKLLAGVPPNRTADALVKLLPVMPMLAPPALVPLLGLSVVIDGAGVER